MNDKKPPVSPQLFCPGCGKKFPQECDWCSDLIKRPTPPVDLRRVKFNR